MFPGHGWPIAVESKSFGQVVSALELTIVLKFAEDIVKVFIMSVARLFDKDVPANRIKAKRQRWVTNCTLANKSIAMTAREATLYRVLNQPWRPFGKMINYEPTPATKAVEMTSRRTNGANLQKSHMRPLWRVAAERQLESNSA
jgi:archaellum biogenesis protein FlaJ (TadC family)